MWETEEGREWSGDSDKDSPSHVCKSNCSQQNSMISILFKGSRQQELMSGEAAEDNKSHDQQNLDYSVVFDW